MAQCFILQANNLTPVITPESGCQGFMMLDAAEYIQWQQTTSFWTYSQEHFQMGFGMVLLAWVVGLGVGLCYSMVRKLRY